MEKSIKHSLLKGITQGKATKEEVLKQLQTSADPMSNRHWFYFEDGFYYKGIRRRKPSQEGETKTGGQPYTREHIDKLLAEGCFVAVIKRASERNKPKVLDK